MFSKLQNLTFLIEGCTVGSIVTMPISGLLTRYDLDGGWPAVFYAFCQKAAFLSIERTNPKKDLIIN